MAELAPPKIRTFETGATRDLDINKLDYRGFLDPSVVRRFAEYMHHHRIQPDGSIRASDNWKKGIPREAYMASGWRHFMDWYSHHEQYAPNEPIEEALCALMFNAQGYLYTLLKERGYGRA